MEPIVSRSSQFVERWAKAEETNMKLGAALLMTGVVCLGLAGALVYASLKPRPIYYIPGAWEAGVALPQAMPNTAVAAFTSSWVLNWNNFTPITVQEAYTRAQRFMSPGLLAEIQSKLVKDMDQIKRDNLSTLFSLTDDPTVTVEKSGFRVTVQGYKGTYMGKEEIKIQRMMYRVRVRTVHPTENNPYGLIIEDVDQEVIL